MNLRIFNNEYVIDYARVFGKPSYIYIYRDINLYLYTYIHTYMHACIRTYIHTYIHTFIHS